MTELPVVDLSGVPDRPPPEHPVARQVDEACRSVGTFVVVGHGVDDAVVVEMYEQSRRFFARPADEKFAVERPKRPELARGFLTPTGREMTGESMQRFSFADFELPDDAYYTSEEGRAHFPPNQFPAGDVALASACRGYFDQLRVLSARLCGLFEAAIAAPAGTFVDGCVRGSGIATTVLYPAIEGADGDFRVQPHNDSGIFTILKIFDEVGPTDLWFLDRDEN